MRDLKPATAAAPQTSLASKTFVLLTLSTLMASIGAHVGFGLTDRPGLVLACCIAELVGLIILYFIREQTALAITVLAGWMALSGITTGVCVNHYVAVLGSATVMAAFLGTMGVTAVCGMIACFSGINFQPLQKWSFILLLGLIVAGIVGWFVHFGSAVNLIYSGIGMIAFVGFFLVDFYRLAASRDDSWSEAIFVTVNIYLDVINFFLFLLRFLTALKGRD